MKKIRTYVALVAVALFTIACEKAVPVGPSPIELDVDVDLTVINDHDDHSGNGGGDGEKTNRAPVLIVPSDQEHRAGDNVSLRVRCLDPDEGDTVTFSARGLPRGLQQDSGSGLVSGEISSSSPESSPFFPSWTCSDGQLSDSGVSQWIVNAPLEA